MTSNEDTLVQFYTDTFISHDEAKVPYKLLKILVSRFEALETVIGQLLNLNDLFALEGINLDNYGKKWGALRQGLDDDGLLSAILDKITIYQSGSTLRDFINVLKIFDVYEGAIIEERLPPEDAEVNVLIDGADQMTLDRVISALNLVRAGGVEIDVSNTTLISVLLTENDDRISLEDGDLLLQES